jgi:hypothetical protein
MPSGSAVHSDTAANNWAGAWQEMPQQSQQWMGNWDHQQAALQQQQQQPPQQAQAPGGQQQFYMQAQAPGGQQQLSMQQQQQHFAAQQQQQQAQQQMQFQGMNQHQQHHFAPQQQQQQQQHQAPAALDRSPAAQAPQASLPAASPAPAEADKPKRKGLMNKPLAKDTGQVPDAGKSASDQAPPAKKGLVNKPIAKDGLVNKPITKESVPASSPAVASGPVSAGIPAADVNQPKIVPTEEAPVKQERPVNSLSNLSTIPNLPVRTADSDSKSMIKALLLEPANIKSVKAKAQVAPKRDAESDSQRKAQELQELRDFAQQKPKGFRLKNASIKPSGEVQQQDAVDGSAKVPDVAAGAEERKPERSSENPQDAQIHKEDIVATSDSKAPLNAPVLLGRETFSRNFILRFYKLSQTHLPKSTLGYFTAARTEEQSPSPGETWKFPRKDKYGDTSQTWRRPDAGKGSQSKSAREVLKPSANAYKVQKAATREAELKRDVRSLLNKICPENKERIIEKLAQTPLDSVEELEIVISIIFHKVTDDPHYCETYVDMVHALNTAYPEFPAEEEGMAPCTFRRMLVNMCQNKFEDLLAAQDNVTEEKKASMSEDDFQTLLIKQKRYAMATMKFIGHLFLRQLLATAVIRTVIGTLLEGTPPELQVEYALELLQWTGHRLDSSKDKAQLELIMARLKDLKKLKHSDGSACLSRRVQFMVDDLVDLRGIIGSKKDSRKKPRRWRMCVSNRSVRIGSRHTSPATKRHTTASPTRGAGESIECITLMNTIQEASRKKPLGNSSLQSDWPRRH